MISVKDFKEWLSKDITINTELQKIITSKIVQYIALNSVESEIMKSEDVSIIDKVS